MTSLKKKVVTWPPQQKAREEGGGGGGGGGGDDGPRINWAQFSIIITGLICMGSQLGFERSLLPRMASTVFHHQSIATVLHFVASFGFAKAIANIIAGKIADRFGRKMTLVLGFLIGLPVMPSIIVSKSWEGIVLINICFGLAQGLIGSALFFLLIDVLGPSRRGIAVGIGECTIYVSTAVFNVIAGDLASRFGYRPIPFYFATVLSLLGLLSTIPLRDTLDIVKQEQSEHESARSRTSVQSSFRSDGAKLVGRPGLNPTISENFASRESEISIDMDNIASRPNLGYGQQATSPSSKEPKWTVRGRDSSDERLRSLQENTPDQNNKEFVSSLRLNSETQVLLANEMKTNVDDSSFHSSDDEEGQIVYGTFKDDGTKSEAVMEGPDPPLIALRKLLFGNKNFAVICFSGMVMNFKDGFAWGSFPVFFSQFHHLSDDHVDILIALYPLCWGFAQAFTGALSDIYGRKRFLIIGIGSCTVAVALFVIPGLIWGRPANDNHQHVMVWALASILLGLGTAFAYPALQAGAADEIEPMYRGVGLGFYRFIRDFGYVLGALFCGNIADAVGGEVGYMVTFIIVSLVMLVSLMLVILVYKPSHWSINRWVVAK